MVAVNSNKHIQIDAVGKYSKPGLTYREHCCPFFLSSFGTTGKSTRQGSIMSLSYFNIFLVIMWGRPERLDEPEIEHTVGVSELQQIHGWLRFPLVITVIVFVIRYKDMWADSTGLSASLPTRTGFLTL